MDLARNLQGELVRNLLISVHIRAMVKDKKTKMQRPAIIIPINQSNYYVMRLVG